MTELARITEAGQIKTHRYKKKPVIVDAIQLCVRNINWVAGWCGGRVISEAKPHTDVYWAVDIPTLEGTMRCEIGDFLIRGVKGEFYPCKPDIFEQTYQEEEEIGD